MSTQSLRPVSVIASEIYQCWKPRVNPAAAPYLDAMLDLESINDKYFLDSGRSVVSYFLANAASFKGEDARRIKAELNQMLK